MWRPNWEPGRTAWLVDLAESKDTWIISPLNSALASSQASWRNIQELKSRAAEVNLRIQDMGSPDPGGTTTSKPRDGQWDKERALRSSLGLPGQLPDAWSSAWPREHNHRRMSPKVSPTTRRTRGATKPSSTVGSCHPPRKSGEVSDNWDPTTRQIIAPQQIQELSNREHGRAVGGTALSARACNISSANRHLLGGSICEGDFSSCENFRRMGDWESCFGSGKSHADSIACFASTIKRPHPSTWQVVQESRINSTTSNLKPPSSSKAHLRRY